MKRCFKLLVYDYKNQLIDYCFSNTYQGIINYLLAVNRHLLKLDGLTFKIERIYEF